jgi:hypothetical protein
MKDVLVRLDHAFEVVNAWLLVIAIGLGVLVATVGFIRLIPPAPPPHAWNVQ